MCVVSKEIITTPGTHMMPDGSIEIYIPIPPITKKNHQQIFQRKNGARFITSSEKYKQYQRECMYFLKELNIDYPVNVEAHYYMPTRRKVDITNLHNALHDILVAAHVLKDDNCRIIVSTDGSRVKYRKNNGGTWIKIEKSEFHFD